ncbi:hypothetical protein AUJ63_00965 [Candidatus Pacearchaeota archaeon CG1_02_35_32]|nr:MAG: hypothetical protein AUJ63_00965 [Candidatus Pacearchaeota archaeon CG1_02_35_32]
MALIFSLIFPIAGFIMGVVGLIVNRKERRYAKNMFTKTGKTLNIVALVVSVILFIASLVAVTYLESALSQIGGI